jgi:hypothetical protein
MDSEQSWCFDLQAGLDTARSQGKAVLLQFHRDECAGCKKMYDLTYPDPDVQQELFSWFVPVRQDILKNRDVRSRYSAYWTPSFFFLDYHGKMLQSCNGYLGPDDFRIILRLGKAALDLPRGRYLQTIDLMDDGLSKFPANPRAAAMLFTRGMAEYLLGKEKSGFRGAMTEILQNYPDSPEARMWPWMDTPVS